MSQLINLNELKCDGCEGIPGNNFETCVICESFLMGFHTLPDIDPVAVRGGSACKAPDVNPHQCFLNKDLYSESKIDGPYLDYSLCETNSFKDPSLCLEHQTDKTPIIVDIFSLHIPQVVLFCDRKYLVSSDGRMRDLLTNEPFIFDGQICVYHCYSGQYWIIEIQVQKLGIDRLEEVHCELSKKYPKLKQHFNILISQIEITDDSWKCSKTSFSGRIEKMPGCSDIYHYEDVNFISLNELVIFMNLYPIICKKK